MYTKPKYILQSSTTSVLVLLICLVLSSCKKSDVAEPTPVDAAITFSTNWKNISAQAPLPADAELWLYPKTGDPIRFNLATGTPQTKILAAGTYQMIIYNTDLKVIKRRGENSFSTHEGYLELKQSSPEYNYTNPPTPQLPTQYADNNNSQRTVVDQADYLHILTGAISRAVTVTPGVPMSVELFPRTITNVYKVNISVANADPILSGYARLSGVATSVNLSNSQLTSAANTVIDFNLDKTDEASFSGSAFALGANPETIGQPNANTLKVVLTYEDPTKQPINQEFDLSKEIKDPNVNLDIKIEFDVENGTPKLKGLIVKPWKNEPGEEIIISPAK